MRSRTYVDHNAKEPTLDVVEWTEPKDAGYVVSETELTNEQWDALVTLWRQREDQR